MAAQYIYAWQLLKATPNAECCNCGKEADDADENEIWTLWNGDIIYCHKCAVYEGISPED